MAEIKIIIDDARVQDFLEGFLRYFPNNSGETNLIFIKKKLIEFLRTAYKNGKEIEASQGTSELPSNIIT